eukprot:1136630-Pelagomonas_calceolata.AAC.8
MLVGEHPYAPEYGQIKISFQESVCEEGAVQPRGASKMPGQDLSSKHPYLSTQSLFKDVPYFPAFLAVQWVKGQGLPFYDLAALMQHPLVKDLVSADAYVSSGPADQGQECSHHSDTGSEISSSSTTTTTISTSSSIACGGNRELESDEDRNVGSKGNSHGHGVNSSSSSSSSSSSIDGVNAAGVVSTDHKEPEGESLAKSASSQRAVRVALREDLGMSDEEVQECDVVCSIPIGRLQDFSFSTTAMNLKQTEQLHMVGPTIMGEIPRKGAQLRVYRGKGQAYAHSAAKRAFGVKILGCSDGLESMA